MKIKREIQKQNLLYLKYIYRISTFFLQNAHSHVHTLFFLLFSLLSCSLHLFQFIIFFIFPSFVLFSSSIVLYNFFFRWIEMKGNRNRNIKERKKEMMTKRLKHSNDRYYSVYFVICYLFLLFFSLFHLLLSPALLLLSISSLFLLPHSIPFHILFCFLYFSFTKCGLMFI